MARSLRPLQFFLRSRMIVKLLQVDGYDLFKFMLSSFSFLISFDIVQSYNDKKILNVSPQNVAS